MKLLLVVLALAAGTTKVIYTPFTGDLIEKRIPTGRCTYGSEVVARFDAWSCVAAGRRLDPCFSRAKSQIVVCVASPWGRKTVVALTKPLPESLANVAGDPRTHAPWALVLSDGQRCVRGNTAAWRCGDGLVLRGPVVRAQKTWRIGDSAIRTAYW